MGKHLTEEHKAAISRGMRGKRNAVGPHVMSEDGLRRLREGQRKRWAKVKEEKKHDTRGTQGAP